MQGRKFVCAVGLVLVFCLFSGCKSNGDFDWVVKIDGREISPSEYTIAQMQAYVETRADGNDDDESDELISQRTIENLKRYIFVEREFENRNLALSEDELKAVETFSQQDWDNISRFYTGNGLDFESYKAYLTYLVKEQLVFNDIYMGDKSEETGEQVDNYLQKNLSRVSVFKVAKVNDDGSRISTDVYARLQSLVADGVSRLNRGEDVNTVASDCLTKSGRLLGSREDYSDGGSFVSTGFVSRSNVGLDSRLVKRIFRRDKGTAGFCESDDCFYIFKKLSLNDTDEEYESLYRQVLSLIKDEDFDSYVDKVCADYTVELNRDAVRYYDRSKITIDVQ